jgi:hypothetical protein
MAVKRKAIKIKGLININGMQEEEKQKKCWHSFNF